MAAKPSNRSAAPEPAAVLRLLGDETRAALYRELATATRAMTASDLAERLGVHANTVRLHLDRLREAGLVEVDSVHRGTVGRPQHVYSLASTAPTLTFDPPAHALLSGLLAMLAEELGADSDDAAAIGRAWGARSVQRTRSQSCVGELESQLTALGFDPELAERPGGAEIAFLQCPFRELAEAYPELVCHLHRGICEGVVGQVGGGNVEEFATLYDPEPCRVVLSQRG
jgi:predicted ArsR family transcriptional regulator